MNKYRPEIDGLRTVAVLSVVGFHAGFGPSAGYVGVDIFFVISGYLITSLLFQERNDTQKIDFLAFYARRIRRLFPALLLVIAFASFVGFSLLPAFAVQSFFASAAASLMFAANLFFEFTTGGYFDPNVDRMPLVHIWSLGVEEQFYLLWPLAISLFAGLKHDQRIRYTLLLIAASFSLAELLMYLHPDAAFYEMPARFWELSAGSLAAFTARKKMESSVQHAVLAFAAVLILCALFIPLSHFPGFGAIPAVFGTAALIFVLHRSDTSIVALALLRSRIAVAIGLASYPLYLWHWPLLVFTDAKEQHAGFRFAVCLVAIILSALTYRFVELPARSFALTLTNRKIVYATFTLTILASVSLVMAGDAFERTHPIDLATRTMGDFPASRLACHFRGDEASLSVPREDCVSIRGKPIRVVIWGDSHALAWQPLAWAVARKLGVAATGLTRDACPPVLDYHNGKGALEDRRCQLFNKQALDWIVANGESIDVLIVTALWPRDISANDFWFNFRRTVEVAAPHVHSTIILGPTPYLSKSVPDCLARNAATSCFELREQFDGNSSESTAALVQLASDLKTVRYVDLADFFCGKTICPAMKDGYGLYWDSNHVSTTAATKFAQQLLDGDQDFAVKTRR